MPSDTITKIVCTALFTVTVALLLVHFWPVVVGLLALVGLVDLIIVLRRHW